MAWSENAIPMIKKIMYSQNLWGGVLLGTLIFTIFILPALPVNVQETGLRIAYTLLFFSAVFSVESKLKSVIVLFFITVCAEWLAGFLSIPALVIFSKILNIISFIIIVIALVVEVASSRVVNLKVIMGAIMGYLLIGLIFSVFVVFIIQHDPGAFNVPSLKSDTLRSVDHFDEAIYFSFVSFATLGYGDIVPLKPYSRSLAMLISISGQLYIAIIIATLVGKYASFNKAEQFDE